MAQHLSGPASLTGQVALITGGAGGMGRAIANAFTNAGARVIATDRGEHEDIGPGIDYRRYDVTSRVDTDKVIDSVLAAHGKVDILVLCAGIIARTPLAQSTDEEWNCDAVSQRARRRQSHAQAVPDHVRARLRQDPRVRFDRCEERRRCLWPRLCRFQSRGARDDALDGQGRCAARCVCQHARTRARWKPRCGPASPATRHRRRTRPYHSGATATRRISRRRHCSCVRPLPIGSPARRWISAAACGWLEVTEPQCQQQDQARLASSAWV